MNFKAVTGHIESQIIALRYLVPADIFTAGVDASIAIDLKRHTLGAAIGLKNIYHGVIRLTKTHELSSQLNVGFTVFFQYFLTSISHTWILI